MPIELVILAAASMAIQFGSHFIPWAQIAGRKSLHPVAAYTIGTVTNLLILMGHHAAGRELTPLDLWINAGFAGAGVGLGYIVDGYRRNRNLAEGLGDELTTRERQLDDATDERP